MTTVTAEEQFRLFLTSLDDKIAQWGWTRLDTGLRLQVENVLRSFLPTQDLSHTPRQPHERITHDQVQRALGTILYRWVERIEFLPESDDPLRWSPEEFQKNVLGEFVDELIRVRLLEGKSTATELWFPRPPILPPLAQHVREAREVIYEMSDFLVAFLGHPDPKHNVFNDENERSPIGPTLDGGMLGHSVDTLLTYFLAELYTGNNATVSAMLPLIQLLPRAVPFCSVKGDPSAWIVVVA